MAPRIVLQRLGGGAGERSADAGRSRAGDGDAAPKQRAAIEQAVAGDWLTGGVPPEVSLVMIRSTEWSGVAAPVRVP